MKIVHLSRFISGIIILKGENQKMKKLSRKELFKRLRENRIAYNKLIDERIENPDFMLAHNFKRKERSLLYKGNSLRKKLHIPIEGGCRICLMCLGFFPAANYEYQNREFTKCSEHAKLERIVI